MCSNDFLIDNVTYVRYLYCYADIHVINHYLFYKNVCKLFCWFNIL